ncbi:hypothetical protein NX059_010880 [Plenodomus lindquistii]|nr:hypothetical protein NX059_010880 [Plenodomus lindquistii]
MAPGLLESAQLPRTNTTPISVPSKEPTTTTTTITKISTTPPSPTNPPPFHITQVLHPSLITTDFDLLRFSAAASEQLPTLTPNTPNHSTKTKINVPQPLSTNLISSPYNNPGHYLSLPSLPLPSILFAKALTALRPVRPDYATAAYTSALNFDHVLGVLRDLVRQANTEWAETSFYVVVFRSKLKRGIDNEWLYKLDYESHREACESGGLLKYWFGKADDDDDGERRNLATCTFLLCFVFCVFFC